MNIEEKLVDHVKICIENATQNKSKINDDILNMEGMSGKYTRHFYNNLCSLEDCRYLEIGTWAGSSVCSAMYKNNATVLCIDNWSEFNGPKDEFYRNFNTYRGENKAFFLEKDCMKVVRSDIYKLGLDKFNIYLYDAGHTQQEQYLALTKYINFMDDTFIFIVDDWNWHAVQKGTKEAISNLNLRVVYEKEIFLTNDNSHSPQPLARDTWWNGIYIAVLSKN